MTPVVSQIVQQLIGPRPDLYLVVAIVRFLQLVPVVANVAKASCPIGRRNGLCNGEDVDSFRKVVQHSGPANGQDFPVLSGHNPQSINTGGQVAKPLPIQHFAPSQLVVSLLLAPFRNTLLRICHFMPYRITIREALHKFCSTEPPTPHIVSGQQFCVKI